MRFWLVVAGLLVCSWSWAAGGDGIDYSQTFEGVTFGPFTGTVSVYQPDNTEPAFASFTITSGSGWVKADGTGSGVYIEGEGSIGGLSWNVATVPAHWTVATPIWTWSATETGTYVVPSGSVSFVEGGGGTGTDPTSPTGMLAGWVPDVLVVLLGLGGAVGSLFALALAIRMVFRMVVRAGGSVRGK